MILMALIYAWILVFFDSVESKIIVLGALTIGLLIGWIQKRKYPKYVTVLENEIKTDIESYKLADINSIEYSDGRTPRGDYPGLYFNDFRGKKVYLPIHDHPFKFAKGLKHLHDSGIKIKLRHFDHELQLFVLGKISEIPMKNEPTTANNR